MMLAVQMLLLLALLSKGVYMAPVMDTRSTTAGVIDLTQQILDETFERALLNDENQLKIEQIFATTPEYVKVCAPVNYVLFCIGSPTCYNSNSTFVWTSLNPSTLTSKLFLTTAFLNWTVFGFEWGGACDFRPSNTPTLVLIIEAPLENILHVCGVDEECFAEFIDRSLRSLTKKVGSTAKR